MKNEGKGEGKKSKRYKVKGEGRRWKVKGKVEVKS